MNVPTDTIRAQVELALSEDIGSGDITAQLLPPEQSAQASVITRETGILCGCDWFDEVFRQIDERVMVHWLCHDADHLEPGQTLCTLSGATRALLTGERTALNFLQTLSGTATVTGHYCQAMGDSKARLLDTRKTIPGLRLAQKYAVLCGGGSNHRIGLFDMVLIKENHITSQGSIRHALSQALELADIDVEIEVETLEQLEQALDCGAKRVLLDNFSLQQLRDAVKINRGRAKLEASGNITLQTIAEIAATGVDYISTGAITKHLHALDLSMNVEVIGH